MHVNLFSVHIGAIGTAEILYVRGTEVGDYSGMMLADGFVIESNGIVIRATDWKYAGGNFEYAELFAVE